MTSTFAVADRPVTLHVGELELAIRWSDKRRTLGLTVDRDGSLVVAAPPHASVEALEEFVREKSDWIHTKLAEKELLRLPTRAKEFVDGEGFSYLGRSYRLLLVPTQDVALKLSAGRFRLRRELAPQGWRHFSAWYEDHGQRWLGGPVEKLARRMGVDPGPIEVRDLGYRWGSCSVRALHFHWAVMTLSPRLIRYVIVHELAHRVVPSHGAEFWRRVERVLPEWRALRAELARLGGGVDVVGPA